MPTEYGIDRSELENTNIKTICLKLWTNFALLFESNLKTNNGEYQIFFK